MAWEIPDEEISSACENEFDAQDSFLLVQEILEARKANKQLQAEIDKAKEDNEMLKLSCETHFTTNKLLKLELEKAKDNALVLKALRGTVTQYLQGNKWNWSEADIAGLLIRTIFNDEEIVSLKENNGKEVTKP